MLPRARLSVKLEYVQRSHNNCAHIPAAPSRHSTSSSNIRRGRRLRLTRHLDVAHSHLLPAGARHAYRHGVRAEPAAVLEEVVRLARRALPRAAAVGADLERRDGAVGVDDLHREPVRRRAALVVQHERRRDAAVDDLVADGDDALGRGAKLEEAVLEQVELALGTLGALVDDLRGVSWMLLGEAESYVAKEGMNLTMAVMEALPLVTFTQAPHMPLLFQTWPEYAVPNMLLGMMGMVVKEQVPVGGLVSDVTRGGARACNHLRSGFHHRTTPGH